jgi:hypothetical protein
MPVVGRSIAHEEGVALISQWIAEMDYPELVERQRKVDRRSSLQRNKSEIIFGRDESQ